MEQTRSLCNGSLNARASLRPCPASGSAARPPTEIQHPRETKAARSGSVPEKLKTAMRVAALPDDGFGPAAPPPRATCGFPSASRSRNSRIFSARASLAAVLYSISGRPRPETRSICSIRALSCAYRMPMSLQRKAKAKAELYLKTELYLNSWSNHLSSLR